MSKLTLQFEGRALKEYVVGQGLTIGRLPDNTIVIDNPAVSGHHARIFREGNDLVLEDLKSTNGTFVNEQDVYRHPLRHGDVVLIGKHKLLYESNAAVAHSAPPKLSGLGDTVYLDTKKHRAMLNTLRAARAEADQAAGTFPTVSVPPSPGAAVLRVVDGDTEHMEYNLDANTSLIGKSESALVRLRGWFKPAVAVAIARNGDRYVATRFGGKTLVNSEPLRGRHDLKDGDILRVSGLTLEFRVKRQHEASSARLMSAGERSATFRALT